MKDYLVEMVEFVDKMMIKRINECIELVKVAKNKSDALDALHKFKKIVERDLGVK